jgi:flagellar biosynthesis/type III secretory pathway chaperone
MTTSDIWLRLDDCIAREIDASQRLLETLREENAALATRDATRIDDAVCAKRMALAELESLDRERERLMRASGQVSDDGAMNGHPGQSNAGRRTQLVDNWMRLLELAGECQKQNAVNGALIQSGLRHTRQALSLLKGQSPGETPQYGPAGQAEQDWARHTLGKV